jgi:hypothetical protein
MSIRVGTPAKPVEILLVQLLLTISTDSLLYTNAGNLTGLRGVIDVLNVAILQHYTGIQEYTNTMIIHLEKKSTESSAKITNRRITVQERIICKG